MFIPFGTHVRDLEGRSVGTVSRLVLHPESREAVAIVVQQGVIDRREVVVPLSKILAFDDGVRLSLRASELEALDASIPDPDAPERRPEPVIAAGTAVYDGAGQHIGDANGVELDPATGRITRVIVRKGKLFRTPTALPAGVVALVADDRVTLSVGADELKKLEHGFVGAFGEARAEAAAAARRGATILAA